MPLPSPSGGESQSDFMGRCMSDLKGEFPDNTQRIAVCMKQFRGGKTKPPVAYDDIRVLVEELASLGKL